MKQTHHNVHTGFGGKIHPGDISPYIILCGSKELAIRFSQKWDWSREAADHYEFLILTGEFKGLPISICSTGIGPAPLAIAMEELANAGIQTILHTSFYPYSDAPTSSGEVIIVKGAIRWDGASQEYVRLEFPALAHFEMTMAAISACDLLNRPSRVKIIGNTEIIPAQGGLQKFSYANQQGNQRRAALDELGAVVGPAEIPLLLVQSSLYGLRAGAIISHGDGFAEEMRPDEDVNQLIDVGLLTMHIIQKWDAEKREKKKKYMTPL